jgi:hypothetical protein
MVVFGLGPLLRYFFSDSDEEFIEVNGKFIKIQK